MSCVTRRKGGKEALAIEWSHDVNRPEGQQSDWVSSMCTPASFEKCALFMYMCMHDKRDQVSSGTSLHQL